jgi:tetratricopeptide (TPR) repeat protein
MVSLETIKNDILLQKDSIGLIYNKLTDLYKTSNFDLDDEDIKKKTNEIRIVFLKNKEYTYSKKFYEFILNLQKKQNLRNAFKEHIISFKIGNDFLEKGYFDEALNTYMSILNKIDSDNKIMNIHPRMISLKLNVGLIYHHKKMYDDAATYLIYVYNNTLNILNNGYDFLKINHILEDVFEDIEKYYCDKKMYDNALKILNILYNIKIYKFGIDHKYSINLLFKIGDLYYSIEGYKQAKEIFTELIQIIDRVQSSDSVSQTCKSKNFKDYEILKLDTMYFLGFIHALENNNEKGYEMMLEVFNTRKKLFGPKNIQTILAYYKLGCIDLKMGKLDQSIQKLKEGYKLMIKKVDKSHNYIIDIKYNLAQAYYGKKDYENAEKIYSSVIIEFTTFFGELHINSLKFMEHIAQLYYIQKKYDLAKLEWCKLIILYHKKEADKCTLLEIYYNLGLTLYALNELNEAEKIMKYINSEIDNTKINSLEVLIDVCKKQYKTLTTKEKTKKLTSKEKIDIKINSRYRIGLLYYYKDCLDDAEKLFLKILQMSVDHNINCANTIYNLSCIYYKKGNYEKSKEMLNKLLILTPNEKDKTYILEHLALINQVTGVTPIEKY